VLEQNGLALYLEGTQCQTQRFELSSSGWVRSKSQQVDVSSACTDSPEGFGKMRRNAAKPATSVVSNAVSYTCKFCRFAHEA